jgi:hypothetical protein
MYVISWLNKLVVDAAVVVRRYTVPLISTPMAQRVAFVVAFTEAPLAIKRIPAGTVKMVFVPAASDPIMLVQ